MFFPPDQYLPVKDNGWARQAAEYILGTDHHRIEELACRLRMARWPDKEIIAYPYDRKTVTEIGLSPEARGGYVNSYRLDRPRRTITPKEVTIYGVLMRDCVRWAHQHGYPVVDAYKPYLDIPTDAQQDPEATVTPAPKPTTPPMVETPALAAAFGRHGVNGWSLEKWKKNLGKGRKNLSKWMQEAWQAGPGTPAPDCWNPVKLALGVPKLKDDNQDEYRRIGRAFAEPELLAWQGEWQRYSDLL